MTSRQRKGLIIIFIPLIVLLIILFVFYYSGFFHTEFEIWDDTPLEVFIFIIIMTLGFLSLLGLLIGLPLGIIYLTKPARDIKPSPAISSAEALELKKQLAKTDNLIFLIIVGYMTIGSLWWIIEWLLRDSQRLMDLFNLSPEAYNRLASNIEAVLGVLVMLLFVFIYILFKKHFKLHKELGLKGVDSLAERLKKYFERYNN